jgi:transposase-like protein
VSLCEIYERFPSRESCLAYLEGVRWGGAPPRCPYCGSARCTAFRGERRYHCNACNTSYSVTVGTIFHQGRADLQKWFEAVRLLVHEQRGLSCRVLAQEISVNRNTAQLMAARIRRALRNDREFLYRLRF